jgi:uncharacterized protein YdaU (DUF1376 family)
MTTFDEGYMHYYQFNIGDYASHTRHLTLLEDLAYRRLLDAYYLQERPLNTGIASVARQINMREHEVEVKAVLEEFFELTDEGWVSRRADAEIAKYQEFIAAGKRGAAKRWGKAEDKGGKTEANREAITPPNATPIVNNNHKPITKDKSIVSADADFEQFWKVWPATPRKVAKAKCLEVWKRKKLGKNVDEILAHVKALKTSKQWKDGFEPAPLTYLNQDRWADEVVLEPKTSGLPAWAAEHYESRRKHEG